MEDTLVVYMGDNGFAFGEHGLIDKRTAYEWSMRVPLVMQCPAVLKGGTVVKQVVANIDLAPTFLEAAGVAADRADFDGRSFWQLARGESIPWRTELLYEYFWERNYPHTPTIHALRGDRYKYVHVHGVWDIDEFYELEQDPGETRNLIFAPERRRAPKESPQREGQTRRPQPHRSGAAGRAGGHEQGAASILVGIAANMSLANGQPQTISRLANRKRSARRLSELT